MRFTEYGLNLANREREVTPMYLDRGQFTQAQIRGTLRDRVNRGNLILLTGGRNLRITVHSVVSAFAHAETDNRIQFAWHLRGDGSRRLVFRT